MTQLRRVRALHFVPCCILHTYSIGCAASQRNNIATIHHTSTVNKISGSFYHPLVPFLSHRSYTFSQFSLFFFAIYSLHLFPSYLRMRTSLPSCFHLASISLPPFSLSNSNHVMSAYLFDFFSSFLFVLSLVLSVPSPFFARLIFSPFTHRLFSP